MTYRDRQRLADIQAAIDAIRSQLQRGDLSDGLVFDAVRIRLLEIGEAVKALPAHLVTQLHAASTVPAPPGRDRHQPYHPPAGRRTRQSADQCRAGTNCERRRPLAPLMLGARLARALSPELGMTPQSFAAYS